MKPKPPVAPPSGGTEGIFYLACFPTGWRILPQPFDRQTEFGHSELWEQSVVDSLAKDWHTTLSAAFRTREQLRAELLPLVYAFPRGRIVRLARRFVVYHGDNLQPFMRRTRQDIERCFGIEGRAMWTFDEHEQCVADDRDRMRELLGLKTTWPAAAPVWD